MWLRWSLYVVLILPVVMAILALAWPDAFPLIGFLFGEGEISPLLSAILTLIAGPIIFIPVVFVVALVHLINEAAHYYTRRG